MHISFPKHLIHCEISSGKVLSLDMSVYPEVQINNYVSALLLCIISTYVDPYSRDNLKDPCHHSESNFTRTWNQGSKRKDKSN
jgi:hypothetical protein